METVRIETLEFAGNEYPKYHYKTKEFGQATYILGRCADEGIRADFFNEGVGLYAKTKIDYFTDIVVESLKYIDKKAEEPKGNSVKYKMDKAIAGYMQLEYIRRNVGHQWVMYTTESKIEQIILNIFLKKIYRPFRYRVFRTLKEMVEHLEEKGVVI